jgi:hypothetical protein
MASDGEAPDSMPQAAPPGTLAADLDIPARVAVFADAYGMTGRQRSALMPLAIRMVHRFHVSALAAVAADPVFRRMWDWDEGVADRMPRAQAWLAGAARDIAERLAVTAR